MNATLYINRSDKRVMLKDIMELATLNIVIKDNTSIAKPTFTVGFDETLLDANYVYIDTFKRYYYLNSPVLSRQIMTFEAIESDVLMSFSHYLTKVNITAKRQSNRYNAYLADDETLVYGNNAIMLKAFPKSFDNYDETFILVTNGGSD